MFSRRLGELGSANPLLAALDKHREAGRPVLDLTESNPTRAGFTYAGDRILSALADPRQLSYEPNPMGHQTTREAIADYYRERGARVDPETLVLTTGTSEAYGYLFRMLAGPGDEILVPKPGYPLLEVLTGLDGVKLVHYPLEMDDRGWWRVDLERLENTVSTRCVAIVAVSPGNPTGSYLKRAEMEGLETVARRFGLALIVDEVFADYDAIPDTERVGCAAGGDEALCFVLNGLSKTVALPQLKLGWIQVSGPADLKDEALKRLEFIADAYLSVSAGVQYAAPVLLRDRAGIQAQIRDRLRENELILRAVLRGAAALRCLPREGGWYAVLARGADQTAQDEEVALDLLREDGVLVHPGYFYDFATDGYLVLSLLTPTPVFRDGIRRLGARLG